MNCRRCHHTDEAHTTSDSNESMLRRGKCEIPDCTCNQFLDALKKLMMSNYNSYIKKFILKMAQV